MKRKLLIVFVLSLSLILLVSSMAFATDWWQVRENEPNNSMSSSDNYKFNAIGVAWEIYGVCSSGDTVDWYRFNPDVSGVGNFELEADVDADIYLYNENGTLLYTGYEENGRKKITNYYMPASQRVYIKVQYNSGAPAQPYSLFAYLNGFSLLNKDKIINKDDVPAE